MKNSSSISCLVSALLIIGALSLDAQTSNGLKFFKKKSKTESTTPSKEEKTKSDSDLKSFSELITDTTASEYGVINIHKNKDDYYFELPFTLKNRTFLVVNKLSKVSSEINGTGLNKGINYENKVITFDIDTARKRVFIREVNPKIEVPSNDAIAQSVQDNFRPAIADFFKIEALGKDSTSVLIKVNKIYDGSNTSINNVFNAIGIGGSAKKDHSHILSMKSFPKNILVKSELGTKVTEGNSSVNVDLDVTSSLVLLDSIPMKPRFADDRIGFFATKRYYFNDEQQAVEVRHLVNRWRLEPKEEDKAAYLSGELVEPKKPIVFYLDPSTPPQWRSYIKTGIEEWQVAFEDAGFKNAIIALDAPEDEDFDADDVRYSVITYAASTTANAMGPSVIDPRSGEVLEADVIWWHNVMTAVQSWIRVQTGITDIEARENVFSTELMGDAIRFVSSHEVGHTLGLMHNMGSSYAYPVDSLRSRSFTDKVGGTAPSIMDYARFNYVVQPGDDVVKTTPIIGEYDKYAIAWAYRWLPEATPWEELPTLNTWINKHKGDPVYRYGEQQDMRTAIDPRSLSEDIGNDAIKAAGYGIANLQRIVPQIVEWTAEDGEKYTKAGKLLDDVMSQWYQYAYHVLPNIGGIYITPSVHGDGQKTYTHVEAEKQKAATQFLIKEYFSAPEWLLNKELLSLTLPVKNKPGGQYENAPLLLIRNAQSFIIWDVLRPERMVRMLENEALNPESAYTCVELLDDLHRGIFSSSIKGKKLNLYEREMQKMFVDALIVSADKYSTAKNYKKLAPDTHSNHLPTLCEYGCTHHHHNDLSKENMVREINYGSASRVSDAVSQKRGELTRIKKLCSSRLNNSDTATKYHYQDLIMRIDQALNK